MKERRLLLSTVCGARTGGCKVDGDAARCTAACPGDSDEERIPLTVRRTGCWESLVPIASLENLNNLPVEIENVLYSNSLFYSFIRPFSILDEFFLSRKTKRSSLSSSYSKTDLGELRAN